MLGRAPPDGFAAVDSTTMQSRAGLPSGPFASGSIEWMTVMWP